MKYIIKNCNCFDKHNTQCLDTPTLPITEMVLCKDITDCVMKRIVEKCQYKLIVYEGEFYKIMQENNKAKEILELLEIEEVDE